MFPGGQLNIFIADKLHPHIANFSRFSNPTYAYSVLQFDCILVHLSMYQSLCPTNALCPRFCFDPAHTTSVDIDFNRERPANEPRVDILSGVRMCTGIQPPRLEMNSETGTSPETVRNPVCSLGIMCLIALSSPQRYKSDCISPLSLSPFASLRSVGSRCWISSRFRF